MKSTLLRVIHLYQAHRPKRLEGICIYTPSCSEYMKRSIERQGAMRGVISGLQRILRCNRHRVGGLDLPN